MSEPRAPPADLEARIQAARAEIEAVGSERAAQRFAELRAALREAAAEANKHELGTGDCLWAWVRVKARVESIVKLASDEKLRRGP